MTDPQTPQQPPAYQPPPAPPAYPTQTDGSPSGAAPYNGAPYSGELPSTPGKTLGIVALVLAIIPSTQLIGLILGIVALVQSRKAGRKNGIAVAAIIVAAVLLVISIIVTVLLVVAFVAVGGDLTSQVQDCIDNGGTGTVVWQGVTMTCEELLQTSGN